MRKGNSNMRKNFKMRVQCVHNLRIFAHIV